MKAFEDAMKIRLGNALAVVFHDYFGVIVPIKPDVYAYTRFSRTVANGVFQKVGPDGFQVFRIGWQCDMTLARKLNFIAILFGHGAEPLNGGFAGAGNVDGTEVAFQSAICPLLRTRQSEHGMQKLFQPIHIFECLENPGFILSRSARLLDQALQG
jgi:hypothetical protein